MPDVWSVHLISFLDMTSFPGKHTVKSSPLLHKLLTCTDWKLKLTWLFLHSQTGEFCFGRLWVVAHSWAKWQKIRRKIRYKKFQKLIGYTYSWVPNNKEPQTNQYTQSPIIRTVPIRTATDFEFVGESKIWAVDTSNLRNTKLATEYIYLF